MTDLVLGIDIGTTSTKIVLVDAHAKIVHEDSSPHDLISLAPGFAEEDAELWWADIVELLRRTIAAGFGDSIKAIGVTGMVPTLVLVDGDLHAVRPSIQQNDARAVEQIDALKMGWDEDAYFRRTGNTFNQQIIFPKFQWLRENEPECVARARWMMGSYDFVATRLTGVPHVELNWALESGMWCIREREWDDETFRRAGVDRSLVPEVFEPTDIVGSTTQDVQAATGLPVGIPVVAGSADHIASTLAVGLQDQGDLLLKFGGAGDIMFVTDTLVLDRRLFVDYHDVPGKYVLNGCMASSGSLIKWYMKLIGETSFDVMDAAAAASGIGAQGLITLPYFLGEKTPIFDAKARGTIFGLDLHHGRGDIHRSIMEAVVFGFRHHVDVLRERGLKVSRVFVSDGGAKDALWRQITADVIGADVSYIADSPGSSMGVALIAGMAIGLFHSWGDATKYREEPLVVRFDPAANRAYDDYYRMYRRLYVTLKDSFSELYSITKGGGHEVR